MFITAAHVVVDPTSGVPYTNGHVFPQYNLPNPTSGIAVANVAYDTAFTAYPPGNAHTFAHDIAFILALTPHALSEYPPLFYINSNNDTGQWAFSPCPQGGLFTDPWLIAGGLVGDAYTWYPPESYCNVSPNTATITAGYPAQVGDIDNSQSVYVYADQFAFLDGEDVLSPLPWVLWELFHGSIWGCTDCLWWTGVGTYVSAGDSGGPIFGENYYNLSFPDYALLGVITTQVNGYSNSIYGFGSGFFDYNAAFISSHQSWNTSSLIQITSPANGTYYSYSSIPNLVATAGLLTSQLSWTSSLDGSLGTGGNVVLQNRLRPGTHIITGSLGAAVSKSIQITITAPAGTYTMNPTTVLVPATATTGTFSMQWNAPGYSSLDLRGRINGGNWNPPVVVAAHSSYGDNIPLGSTWDYQFFPHGDTTHVLASLSVHAIAAPAPTFHMTPTHIIVPAGQTSGTFSMDWNAPGYSSLDLQGHINNGGWNPPVQIAASGTYGDSVPVGSTYYYRFLPHGDTAHVLGSLTVYASH